MSRPLRHRPMTVAPWQKPKPASRKKLIPEPLREQVYARAGRRCELCGEPLGRPFQAHHRKLRSRGGLDSVCNLVALHGKCHNRVHSHPAWAAEHGWMVASGDDPATVPVAVHGLSWRLLTVAGGYRDVGGAA